MNKVGVMIFLIVVICAGVLYIVVQVNLRGIELPDAVRGIVDIFIPEPREESFEAVSDTEGNSGESGGGGGGGSAGGGGRGGDAGGGEEPSSSDCTMVDISHALKSFNRESVCNEFAGETCIDKSVTCSVEVYNLDDSVSGAFEVQFDFYEVSEEILSSFSQSENVDSESHVLFSHEETFVGNSANLDLTCSMNLVEVPTRAICY